MNFRLKSQKLELSENDVEEQCIGLLGLRGYKVIRLHVGRFQTIKGGWVTIGEPGLPDYVAVHKKHPAFFLEVKRPGKKASPEQERKHCELRIQGLPVTTADSVTGLKEWLELHGRSP
jgi:hypothetical protein